MTELSQMELDKKEFNIPIYNNEVCFKFLNSIKELQFFCSRNSERHFGF